jgi:hypothetical protein
MAARSAAPRLRDIVGAIDRIRMETEGVSLDAFEADWRKRWLVERFHRTSPVNTTRPRFTTVRIPGRWATASATVSAATSTTSPPHPGVRP